MNKEEYRNHCEKQIEMCIRFHDSKHLKEHELSLALLNENEMLIKNKNNLIKYLENKINEVKIGGCDCQTTNMFEIEEKVYQDILERVKNNNYE